MKQITLYIGRDKSNDIVIDNQSVSRQHATVTFSNGEFRIQDNKSLNGVFVNGHKVDNAVITASDRITLGTSEPLDWTKITKAMDSKRNTSERNQAGDGQIIAVYTISIGRSESNDIVLNNPGVSRQHASIISKVYANKQSFEIRDNESQNGTFVNGERITNRVITPSDKISLGTKTELSWNLIATAITQKIGTIDQTPKPQDTDIRPNIAPIYIPETAVYEEYREQPQKRQGNAGWLVAGVVGGLVLIIGFVLFSGFGRRSYPNQGSLQADKEQHINVSSRYQLKPGEPQDIAQRRAKIEAQRELLKRAIDFFPNNNPFATNYAIFSPEITNQSFLEDEQAFVTDISAQMSAPDFQAKMDYINTHQDLYGRLEALQSEYDANYSLVGAAESNMIQSYHSFQESSNSQNLPSYAYDQAHDYDQGQSTSISQEYYNDCVQTYLDQLEHVEHSVAAMDEPKVALNSVTDETKIAGKDKPGFVDKVKSIFSGVTYVSNDPMDMLLKNVNLDYSTWNEYVEAYEIGKGSKHIMENQPDIGDFSAYKKTHPGGKICDYELTPDDFQKTKLDENTYLFTISDYGIDRYQTMTRIPWQDTEFKRDWNEEYLKDIKYYMIKEQGKWRRYLHQDDSDYRVIKAFDYQQ